MEYKTFKVEIIHNDGYISTSEVESPLDYLEGYFRGDKTNEYFKRLQDIRLITIKVLS